jgi:UDP-glucose 4-epimerase
MNLNKSNRILITGATGFIGSHLTKNLLEGGHEVACLSRSEDKFSDLNKFVGETSGDALSFIKCDLGMPGDLEAQAEQLEEYEILIHLAANITGSEDVVESGPAQVESDLKGTLRLLQHLPNLKRLCYFSSMAVFGAPECCPVKEDTPLGPENVYGICKLTMEKYLRLYSETEDIPVSILRPSSVYGPLNTSARAIPFFIDRVLQKEPMVIFGDGEQLRDYIYVEDMVDAIKLALKHSGFDIFNIGAGSGISINELLNTLHKVAGVDNPEITRKSLPEDATTFDFYYDITKARKLLGFEPKISLEEGLRREFQWHKSI